MKELQGLCLPSQPSFCLLDLMFRDHDSGSGKKFFLQCGVVSSINPLCFVFPALQKNCESRKDFSSREVDLGLRTGSLAQKIATFKTTAIPLPSMGNSYLSFTPTTDRGLGDILAGLEAGASKEWE